MSHATCQDRAARAASSCAECKAQLAEAICTIDRACTSLEYTCRDMDWEEEPCFDMRDAMRCAGLALAKLVEWEKEDKDEDENGGKR